jgi:hypothetical protein
MKKNWIIIIIVALITILSVSLIFILLMLIPQEKETTLPVAVVSFIEAPSSTPILLSTWTPTSPPQENVESDNTSEFQINNYVQISGTEGEGLRIRSGPGRDNSVFFIGLDSELFKIIDGPIENDGYIWWHLEAPYDTSRNGWSVQDYLSIVETP